MPWSNPTGAGEKSVWKGMNKFGGLRGLSRKEPDIAKNTPHFTFYEPKARAHEPFSGIVLKVKFDTLIVLVVERYAVVYRQMHAVPQL